MTVTPCALASAPDFFTCGIQADVKDPRGSRAWFKFGTFLVSGWRPIVILLVAYGCMVPVICQLWRYMPEVATTWVSEQSPERATLNLLSEAIGEGEMLPVLLLSDGEVRSEAAFGRHCQTIRRLAASTQGTAHELLPKDFFGPFAISGSLAALIPNKVGVTCPDLTCLHWDSSPPDCPILPSARELLMGGSSLEKGVPGVEALYQAVWRRQISKDNQSSITVITTPFGQEGSALSAFADALKGSGADYFFGSMIAENELSIADNARLPLVIGLALLAQSLFVMAGFGTVLVPIKMIFTVIAPLCFVLAVLVCVYQQGALTWTHWSAFKAEGVFWLVPISSSAILLALSVDYEVFLFARIFELRKAGYDNKSAIVGGLATTGPKITAAGIIMFLAFFGMLLSSVGLNREVGFVLAFGVLLDTFVVRAVLVPCILSVGGGMNYWPAKMPEPTRFIEDMEEYITDVSGSSGGLNPGKAGFAEFEGEAKRV